MNILYIDHYAGSAKHGRSFRPHYLGQECVKNGHSFVVVGGTFSHLRQYQPSKAGLEVIDGVKYLWLKTPYYTGNGIRRVWSMIIFTIQLFLNINTILKLSKPDVIVGSCVYMLDMYPAWLMKKLSGSNTSLVFELHDIWPMTIIQIGNMSRLHPLVLLMRLSEWWAYTVADLIISIIPNSFQHIKKFGIEKERFCHIPNGIVVSDWQNYDPLPDAHQALIQKLHGQRKFIIGYAGAFSLSNSVYNLLDAALIVNSRHELNIAFIMMGNGLEKPKLIEKAKGCGINNLYFLDPVPKKAIPAFLMQMDALYFGVPKKEIYKYGVSANKIFDYMMSGRPVIQSASSSNDIIKEAGCGITVQPDSPKKVVDAILKLQAISKSELDNLGFNGKIFAVKNHDYQILAHRFISFIASRK